MHHAVKLQRWRDITVWWLQLAYLENFREEKQSVSTAHSEDRQKGTQRLREKRKKVRQREWQF